jgi:uncharacterized protein
MDFVNTYTAFDGQKQLCQGELSEVVLKIKKSIGKSENTSVLIFSDETGKTMDFNFQGSEKDVHKRLEMYVDEVKKEVMGPGRPKLGVVSREVSLLPRHWEWLANQTGGASATLRKLVEEAKKKTSNSQELKQAQERTYKFISVMAGDLAGYEEALRALYKKDKKLFLTQIQLWPADIKNHAVAMAQAVFDN